MSMDDRARARLALAFDRQPADGPCPSPEEILCWHENTLDAVRVPAIEAHVARCEQCFALWSGLVDVEPAPATQSAPQATPRWWERWRPGFAIPALAAGVAAVAVWFGMLGGEPLPGYDIQLRGGMEVRGAVDDSQPLTLIDDTLLEIVLTPEVAIGDQVAMRVFAQTEERVDALAAPMLVTDKGVASIEGIVGIDIIVPEDTRRLLVVLGREGELPDGATLVRALGDRPEVTTPDWQGWSIAVTVQR